MRLFIGLFLPPDIIAGFRRHIESFGDLPPFRWTSDSALHITLKFIGEAKEENVSIFRSVLSTLAGQQKSFKLQCEGGGVFPNARRPRVFWTGIGGEVGPLKDLAGKIESEFDRLGFPPENRKFSPHVTLAKVNKGGPLLKKLEKHFSTYRSPVFNIGGMDLIQSQLTPTGSRYTTLASFEFNLS